MLQDVHVSRLLVSVTFLGASKDVPGQSLQFRIDPLEALITQHGAGIGASCFRRPSTLGMLQIAPNKLWASKSPQLL